MSQLYKKNKNYGHEGRVIGQSQRENQTELFTSMEQKCSINKPFIAKMIIPIIIIIFCVLVDVFLLIYFKLYSNKIFIANSVLFLILIIMLISVMFKLKKLYVAITIIYGILIFLVGVISIIYIFKEKKREDWLYFNLIVDIPFVVLICFFITFIIYRKKFDPIPIVIVSNQELTVQVLDP